MAESQILEQPLDERVLSMMNSWIEVCFNCIYMDQCDQTMTAASLSQAANVDMDAVYKELQGLGSSDLAQSLIVEASWSVSDFHAGPCISPCISPSHLI
jgi:hypothetical protein